MARREFDSIPSVHEWSRLTGLRGDIASFVGNALNPEVLLAASHLLWPAFVEVRGCVLLATPAEEIFDAWWSSYEGDTAGIEAVMNHLHLSDMFMTYEDAESVLAELADVLVELWSAALRHAYPERRFHVYRDDHHGPGVTFASVPVVPGEFLTGLS